MKNSSESQQLTLLSNNLLRLLNLLLPHLHHHPPLPQFSPLSFMSAPLSSSSSSSLSSQIVGFFDDDKSIEEMQSMRANNITFEMHQFRNLKFSSHLLHGTTTLAFIYKNGIIVAVDSRATAGSIIATHNIKKIIEFSPGILGTMAGNAAACQHAGVSLSHQIKIFTMRNDKQPSMTVCGRLLQSFFRETNSGHGTSGMMLCGFDHKGPQIVYCDSELNFLNFEKFSIGSGMQSALAVLFDEEDIYNVEDEKAYEIARHAIKVAASRDAGSGGCSMVYHIKEDGWKKIGTIDMFV